MIVGSIDWNQQVGPAGTRPLFSQVDFGGGFWDCGSAGFQFNPPSQECEPLRQRRAWPGGFALSRAWIGGHRPGVGVRRQRVAVSAQDPASIR
jgi:hypothetical protein